MSSADRLENEYHGYCIQTKWMREMWKKLAHRVVICDSTACISQYKHVLYALVGVDERNRGIVLAWLVVPSESQRDLTPLLEKLLRINGATTPKYFISDDAPALYNSWLVILHF